MSLVFLFAYVCITGSKGVFNVLRKRFKGHGTITIFFPIDY